LEKTQIITVPSRTHPLDLSKVIKLSRKSCNHTDIKLKIVRKRLALALREERSPKTNNSKALK
jgi:hypothetical protein